MNKILLLFSAIVFVMSNGTAKDLSGGGRGKVVFERTIVVKQAPAPADAGSSVLAHPAEGGMQLEQLNALNKNSEILTPAAGVNLTPYQPSGWSDKIVLYSSRIPTDGSTVPTSLSDAVTIYTNDSVFVGFAYVNNGTDPISTRFYTKIYVDDVDQYGSSIYIDQLSGNFFRAYWNGKIGLLTAGTHSFRIEVDASNTIAETNEGDNSYTRQRSIMTGGPGIPSNLEATAMSSGQINVTWAASSGDPAYYIILRSTTSGSGFTPVDTIQNGSLTKYFSVFLNPSTTYYYQVIAGNSDGKSSPTPEVSATTFGYSTAWTIQNQDAISWYGVKAVDTNMVWACGYSSLTDGAGTAYVARTTNGGATWVNSSGTLSSINAAIFTIEPISATEAWVGDENGNIYYTTNGGSSWATQSSGAANFINAIKYLSANTLVAVADPLTQGGPFLILRSTNKGTNWNAVPGTPNSRSDVQEYCLANSFCAVGNILYVGTAYYEGTSGRMIKSTDGGVSWQILPIEFQRSPWTVAFRTASVGIMAGAEGYANYSATGGSGWSSIDKFVPGSIRASQAMTGTTTYWLGGYNGVFRSTDDGVNWSIESVPFTKTVDALSFPSQTRGWVASTGGLIARYVAGSSSTTPSIATFTPSSGSIGTLVTISGNSFGAAQGTSTVKFGSTSAAVTSWSNVQIVATVPSLIAGNYTISVTVNAQTVTAFSQFTVTSGTALSTPLLQFPTNGAPVTPPVTLQWLSVASADIYDIEIGSYVSTTFKGKTFASTVNTIVVDTLAPGTTYSWRVRARSSVSFAVSAWTPFNTFTTSTTQTVAQQIPAQFSSSPGASTDYRLFTFPSSNTTTVASLLKGEAKKDYRIFRDNGGVPPNHLTELFGESSLISGEGYWLVKKGNFVINQQSISFLTPVNGAVFINLKGNNWNIIGNPYTVPVQWSEVTSANGLSAGTTLYSYGGVSGFTPVTSLKPFIGYYYFNSGGATSLSIPYPFTFVAGSVQTVPPLQIGIVYSSSVNSDASTFIGIDARAKKELDEFDARKPPVFDDQGFVYFNRPVWDSLHSHFSSDIRPELGEGQSWDFVLHHPLKEQAQLNITGLDKLPEGYSAVLIDNATKSISHLTNSTAITVTGSQRERLMTLVIGKSDYIKQRIEQSIPTEYQLMQNYPNPFNPATTIAYALPQASIVTLKIFDMLGREVAALADGIKSEGEHTVLFDASMLASGMYFYRLEARPIGGGRADRFIETKKLVLTR